ncbi:DUF2254 domain-containing protein [Sphaerisporangium sp. NPDC088356]|uniref:DUF2254 domain-containing protein n=1 Tax=Sphaerisporangium sp. NPDC088356 TaxID=3154871 RepID=UPI00341E86F2
MAFVTTRAREFLKSRRWPIPLLCVFLAVGLSYATSATDRHFGYTLIGQSLTGTPASVQTILSTIATAMVTLVAIVLTVTLVAIQLAMGQFSPRIVSALLHDYPSKFASGVFVATFTFAVLALREVRSRNGDGTVPGLTVLTAYVLVLVSLITLILYIDHAGRSLRAAGLINLVGTRTRAQLDRMCPAYTAVPPADRREESLIFAPRSGVVTKFDIASLVTQARRAGCLLEMLPAMGEFVIKGTPLFRVHGSPAGLATSKIVRYVILATERTHEDDPAYGFRKLVDIAERGVSTTFYDPTTTVQAIDRLHDVLRQVAPHDLPTGRYRDRDNDVRLVVPVLGWDGYVRLAFDEIRLAGSGSPQVTRRMRAALDDLKAVARPDRQSALDRQIRLLEAAVRRAFEDEEDVIAALIPDRQGIGSGRDVVARTRDADLRADTTGPDGQPGSRPT